MSPSHRIDVARFYDTHPINEEEILAKLAARGLSLDALTQDELKDFVKERLAPYKYPRLIEFISELPKTATGKIQRYRLRDFERERAAARPTT